MITKRTKLFLIALVLVAIGAHAYLYWWSRTADHGFLDDIEVVRDASQSASDAVIKPRVPAPAPEEGTSGDSETAVTYTTYENTELGFTFSYPDTWVPSATRIVEGTDICLIKSQGTGGCLVTVSFDEESVNLNEDIALDALRAEVRKGRANESSRRIAGEDATMFQVSGYPKGEEGITRAAVFTHERQVYVIKASAGQESAFDRIASSFRFVD